MKWDGDPNKDLKWNIFDILRIKLPEKDADKITVRQIVDAIDEMVDKLTSISNE
jgi:hypothetical protein